MNDLSALSSITRVLAALTVFACVIPAWRAARGHPAVALRQE